MRKVFPLLMVLLAASCSRQPLELKDRESILLRAGPVFLTRSELESKVVELGPDYARYLRTRQGKRAMLEAVVKEKLLVREAMERGIGRERAIQEELQRLQRDQEMALRLYKESILVQEFMQRLKGAELRVTDAEIANYYKEHQKLYHVRQILISDRKAAEDILSQLKKSKGALIQEFARLAKSQSLEAQSAREGGKITPFMQGELDPVFERAVMNMSAGQVSEPVETPLGLHVILMEGSSIALYADEIRQRCRRILEKQKLDALMEQWKKRYVMEVRDESLKPYLNF